MIAFFVIIVIITINEIATDIISRVIVINFFVKIIILITLTIFVFAKKYSSFSSVMTSLQPQVETGRAPQFFLLSLSSHGDTLAKVTSGSPSSSTLSRSLSGSSSSPFFWLCLFTWKLKRVLMKMEGLFKRNGFEVKADAISQ